MTWRAGALHYVHAATPLSEIGERRAVSSLTNVLGVKVTGSVAAHS